MTNIFKSPLLYASFAMLLATACGPKDELAKKKAELEALKNQSAKLEDEITKMDTAAAKAEKAKLVTISPVAPVNFEHFISLQGIIDAENISYVTPRNGGGQVKEVLVKQGDAVHKGQLLLRLDDAITKQNLNAAEQRLQELNTQIAYAKDILKRQQNLWNDGIGTEVQLITAKNNVASLENQLKSAQEGNKVTKEQLNTSNVYADVDGVADDVSIRVGEFFTGNPTQGIRIVNTSNLKVTAQVPESYIDKVKTGNTLQVYLPDVDKHITTKITTSGKLIDPLSRAFYIDAKIPADKDLRPNQVAMVKIQDYASPQAITIPLNTLQNDEKGKYVLVAVKEGNKLIARKKPVTIGELQDDKLEVKSGIVSGDVVITEGFQGLYDGQLITTQ